MKNIVLIGFMGSGKSSIAKKMFHRFMEYKKDPKHPLYQKNSFSWIDSDEYIAKKEGRVIAQIFQQEGEQYFRALEADFIQYFHTQQNYIIATGGGMPIYNDVSGLGICFYLQSDFDVICNRLQQDVSNVRPLFQDMEKARGLYLERHEIYKRSSNYCINANVCIEDVLKEIEDILLQCCGDFKDSSC